VAVTEQEELAGGSRRTPGWPVAAAVGAVVVVVLAVIFAVGGRGWFAASPGSPAEPSRSGTPPQLSPSGLLPKGDYRPKDQQQAGECDGVAPVAPEDLRLLNPRATVTAAVICTSGYANKPGDGRWLVRKVIDVPAGGIPALVAALSRPDVADVSGACSAMAVLVADFVVTLSDGSRIRPGVPGDGCHPSDAALAALGSAAARPVRTSIPISQVATQQEVTSGCGAEAKSPAIWLDAGGGTKNPADRPVGSALPATGQVAVCRYAPQDEPALGTLRATGSVTTDALAGALRQLATTAPSGCPSPATVENSPATDWLMVQALPASGADQPAPAPLLLVELDGCRRVVETGQGVIGYLPTDVAPAVGALADQTVR
jgi:hypothetical protein